MFPDMTVLEKPENRRVSPKDKLSDDIERMYNLFPV